MFYTNLKLQLLKCVLLKTSSLPFSDIYDATEELGDRFHF